MGLPEHSSHDAVVPGDPILDPPEYDGQFPLEATPSISPPDVSTPGCPNSHPVNQRDGQALRALKAFGNPVAKLPFKAFRVFSV